MSFSRAHSDALFFPEINAYKQTMTYVSTVWQRKAETLQIVKL